MIYNIKEYLQTKSIEGNIILYRDKAHKKKALCEYLAENITTDKPICFYSSGAFGLYMAKAFPNNQIVILGKPTTEYQQQIDKLPNVTINTSTRETSPISTNRKDFAEANGFYFVDHFGEPLIENYYKNHFANILEEAKGFQIDTFCDCGHSCATLSGAIASGTDLDFVLGVVGEAGSRIGLYYLDDKQDKFTQETTKNFDTKQIQTDIESMYPDFGNIYEATRSISAAMSWLQKNPGKTVLVYVGDSPVFGEDAEI